MKTYYVGVILVLLTFIGCTKTRNATIVERGLDSGKIIAVRDIPQKERAGATAYVMRSKLDPPFFKDVFYMADSTSVGIDTAHLTKVILH
jgi:hypothetical protein